MDGKYYSYRYNAWFGSIVSQAKLLCEYKGLFPEMYYDFLYRDDARTAIAFADCPEGFGSCFEDAVRLIKSLGRAKLVPAHQPCSTGCTVSCEDGAIFIDGTKHSEADCAEFLKKLESEYVLTEYFDDPAAGTVDVLILSRPGESGMLCEMCGAFASAEGGFEPLDEGEHAELISTAKSVAAYLAFFEFLQFKFVPCGDGFKLINVSARLTLPEGYAPSEALTEFAAKWDEMHEHPDAEYAENERREREFNEKWTHIAETEHRSGMRPYMASMWDEELRADMADESITDAERRWAYERGFFGYRIKEQGLTEENYRRYVPDYDYFWVNRINPDYQLWIADKLASRFALGRFKSVLPEYYYAITRVNGASKILPLPELPKGFGLTYDSLFALLKEKKLLAVKRTYGTHGQGFNKLEYRDGEYILNGKPTPTDKMITELFSAEGVYLVTEYVTMHEWFRKFYPETLNTVRVTCFCRTNEQPQIGGCFMRLGHSKGGYTDNINTAAGGISTSIDKSDGRVIEPEFKRGNHYTPCPVHPDTGVPIEGNIPHWDMIVDGVKAVCRSMPQLQYFGFDIAVTPTGYKIIEINVFSDYTKYLLRDEKTQEFLAEKVRQKFYRYRIDLPERCRTGTDGAHPQYKFKFSIVAPDETTAKGFVGQTMGFKENVQLIVTGECGELKTDYPKNVVRAADRSCALHAAEGKYILFAETGDIWPQSTLATVWDMFEAMCGKTDVLACRQRWTGGKNGWIKLDYKFANGSGVFDIDERPDCIQTSLCSAFLRTDAAKKCGFDESEPVLGDCLLVNELVLRRGAIGLCTEAVCTRHFENAPDDEADPAAFSVQCCRSIFALSERIHGKVVRYAQYLAADELWELAVSGNVQSCDGAAELLRRIDAHVIATTKNCSLGAKGVLLRVRDGKRFDETLCIDGDDVSADDEYLGMLNAAGALTVYSVETGSQYLITGRVLLPGFVTEPEMYLADAESGKKLAETELTAAPEEEYRCLDSEYSYIPYDFELAVAESLLASRNRFMLVTDTEPIKLSVNFPKGSELAAMRSNGELCVKKKGLIDMLKRSK